MNTLKVRTFHGATVDQAVRRAQVACGTDAIILHQTHHPGWQVWHPRWTVTVALNDTPTAPSKSFQQMVPASLRNTPPPAPPAVAPGSKAVPQPAPKATPSPTASNLLAAEDRELLVSVLQAIRTQKTTDAWTWPVDPWPLHLLPETQEPQRIACIGPTGAGKTTTIGKLAAWSALRDHQPTRLITTDTFRAGATAQIEQFARVLRIPCTVVASGQAMPQGLAMESAGRWFLDTPGVTARETYRLAEIQAWLQAFQPTLTYVVLPASLAVERFAALATLFQGLTETTPTLLLTKVDEVDHLTEIAQVVTELGWAWSYLGTGQRVPDDLVPATLETVQTWTAPEIAGVMA